MKRINCEICNRSGNHIPNDQDASEIDLIGFMITPENSVEPKWMCQSCYDAFQAINPDATPIMIQYAP